MGIASFESEAITEALLKYLKFSCVRLLELTLSDYSIRFSEQSLKVGIMLHRTYGATSLE